jgi:hypothetical protein
MSRILHAKFLIFHAIDLPLDHDGPSLDRETSGGSEMAARLGNVLYWAANVVALLFLLPGGWGWFLKYRGSELESSKDTIDDFIRQAAKARKGNAQWRNPNT